METKNKILVVGDIHFRPNLSFADFIDDKREPEEKKILDFITRQSEDCSTVVFLGDLMNGRINPPGVIKKVVNFIETFNGKEIFILKGNHDDCGNKSTLDFLAEVKGKSWKIITNKIEEINGMVFCPYFSRNSLEVKTNEEGSDKLLKLLPKGNLLFLHHAVTDTIGNSGASTSIFDEIVLSRKKLEKKYKLIFAGHIHRFQQVGNTTIVGSIFSHDINEKEKFIFKLDPTTMKVEQIILPGRSIYGLTNPTLKDLEKIDKSSIVKVTLTKKYEKKELAELKDKLEEFSAHMLIENIKDDRKKLHLKKGATMIDFTIENLLKLYSEERSVPLEKLTRAFELIK